MGPAGAFAVGLKKNYTRHKTPYLGDPCARVWRGVPSDVQLDDRRLGQREPRRCVDEGSSLFFVEHLSQARATRTSLAYTQLDNTSKTKTLGNASRKIPMAPETPRNRRFFDTLGPSRCSKAYFSVSCIIFPCFFEWYHVFSSGVY